MSFGLRVSFGRLCKLEELQRALLPRLPDWETDDALYCAVQDGIEVTLKAALSERTE